VYLIYRWVIRVLYTIFKRSSVKKRVAFLSRQSGKPSLDFTLLESALRVELPGWEFATSCYRDTGSLTARVRGTLRQLRLVANSRLCIVDGYTPAVSIPRLDPSTVVVQIWHALGTFKRFGWQALDGEAGRTRAQAEQLMMHRQYSLVIAGGEGPRTAYAQAFDCPESKIIPLGMPRMDYLLDDEPQCERKRIKAAVIEQYPQLANGRVNVLFAPTLRKGNGRANARRHLEELASHLPAETFNLIVAFHPLSTHRVEGARVEGEPLSRGASDGSPDGASDGASHVASDGSPDGASHVGSDGRAPATPLAPITHIPHIRGIDLLELADYVVTDYSAIAFEAALLRRKVVFYVPDIVAYRDSPGLNIDPEEQFAPISFRDAASLARFIQRDAHGDLYAASGFWPYCDAYLAQPAQGATARLARRLSEAVT
jgi:CDP-ribitol ribitolphosphotransferase